MLEAEVFTTVSSEAQAEYLMKMHGIQRNRIFQSRDDSFVQALMAETNGRGVDLALNSLSGELLHATWRNCIASWGMMIEIGKRDLLGVAQLDMDVFLANRSYCCVDIDQMREDRPELVERYVEKSIPLDPRILLTNFEYSFQAPTAHHGLLPRGPHQAHPSRQNRQRRGCCGNVSAHAAAQPHGKGRDQDSR